MKKLFSKINSVFALILVAYCALGIYWIRFYQYQINPDGISYIAIAEKYLAGNFAEAVNGYWMPLYSWLLAPLLALGIFPLLATKILGLIIGLLALIGARWLASRFALTELTKNILLAALIPVMIFFAFNRITPDFLIVGVLIFYLAAIFDPSYANGKYDKGLLCGALGSLAYLAKGYGLPFFLAHFFIFNGLLFFTATARVEKRNVLKNFAGGLMVFFIISGPWIFLISQKYGRLTFNTAAGYNYAVVEGGDVFYNRALLPPPNATATSNWEDPAYFDVARIINRGAAARTPAKVRRDTTNQSEKVSKKVVTPKQNQKPTPNKLLALLIKKTAPLKRNLAPARDIFQAISGFSFIILLAAMWYCRPLRREKLRSSVFYSLLTLTIYSFGYMLIAVEDRYFWIAAVLLMMMAAYFFDLLFKLKKSFLYGVATMAMLAAVMYSFCKAPADFLLRNKGMSRQFYQLSQKLQREYAIHGNVACDRDWGPTLYLSYFNGYKYYGVPNYGRGGGGILQQLEENNIAYYFVWNDDPRIYSPFKEITGGQISGLRIYDLRERDHSARPPEKTGVANKNAGQISAIAPFSCCAARLPAAAFAQETWATVFRDTLRLELVETGEVSAVRSTFIDAPLLGSVDLQVVEIAPEGEPVDSAAVLVRFDPAILASTLGRERSELQAGHTKLKSLRIENELKLSELQRYVDRAEYFLQLARMDLQVLQYASGTRRKQGELEVLKAELALKEARMNLKNGQILQAPAEIQQELEVALAEHTVGSLEEDLEHMTLRAPLPGMVVYLPDENGEKPQLGKKIVMGQGVINLPDLSRMQVTFKVHARDAAKLQMGQKALVHLEAYPNRHFYAKLVSLNKIPVPLEADSQVRVFEAIVEIVPNQKGAAVLKPGTTAKVNLVLDEIPNALLLPIRCVYEIDGAPVVFTEKSGTQPVPVTLGARNNYFISVEGLPAEAKVAWEPAASAAQPLGYAEFRRRQSRSMDDYEIFFTEMAKRGITFDYDATRRPAATSAQSTNGTTGAMNARQN